MDADTIVLVIICAIFFGITGILFGSNCSDDYWEKKAISLGIASYVSEENVIKFKYNVEKDK